MKNIFGKLKNFILNNKWWTALIIFIIIIFSLVLIGKNKKIVIETVSAQRQDIIQEVSTTGNVKPLYDLDLSFESTGQISKVNVSVGDKIEKGQKLAELSNADLVAALEQAQAGLRIAEANYEKTINGAIPEEIAVNQSQVEKAKNDLSNSAVSFLNAIKNAFTKADDSVRNYADTMISNSRSSSPILLFQTDADQNKIITDNRIAVENLLISWNTLANNININSDFIYASNSTYNNLIVIQAFLQDLSMAVNKLSPNILISQATITAWKTNVSTARTNIDLAISGLSSAVAQYQSSISAYNIANNQLALVRAIASDDVLKVQRATVEQARANVDAAAAGLQKTIITSPIDGVVANVIAKVGQTIQPGILAISVISNNEYNIESFVPEVDIAKINIGNFASTTLDAYGTDTFFESSVVKIDPAETVLSGVPTYKVTLRFASSDERIKSGMTANLDILTAQRNNVLAIPSRCIYSRDSKKYVKIIDSKNNPIETVVATGLRGVDGYTEIIFGLKEGDNVMVSPNI